MPSVKNSYPKRAYRRTQRQRIKKRRIAVYHRTYDSGYDLREGANGEVYVVRTDYYRRMKRGYKQQARRRARMAPYGVYGLRGGSYRKAYDLWWSIY